MGPIGMTVDIDGVTTNFVIQAAEVWPFNRTADTTELVIEAANSGGSIVLHAMGTKPGTFNCTGDVYVTYTVSRGTWSTFRTGASCTITITNYGAVGQPLAGTFSGKLTYLFGVTGTKTFTNGTFTATRDPDNLN